MSILDTIKKLFKTKLAIPENWTLGIDTSHWDGVFDWKKAKSKGVKWMIGKVSDVGSDSKRPFYDDKANENYYKAKDEGILTGGYHWLDPTYDPIEQAHFYLTWYFSHPVDFQPVVDFEDSAFFDKNDYVYKLQKWLEIVEQETKRIPIIYTAEWFMAKMDRKKTSWMGRYPLWVAQYVQSTKPTSIPREWDNWKIWQYNSVGHYPYYNWAERNIGKGRDFGSYSAELDMNWFSGTYAELLEFIKREEGEDVSDQPVLFLAKCNTDTLNIRSGPHITYPVIGYLRQNNEVGVFEVKDGWYRITQEPKWVMGNFMKKIGSPEPPVIIPPQPEPPQPEPPSPNFLFKAMCTTGILNIRSGPGSTYSILGTLEMSQIRDVYEVKNDWYKISKGWVSSKYMFKLNPVIPPDDPNYPPTKPGVLYYPMDEDLVYYTQMFGENPGTYPTSKGHNGLDWGTNYKPGYNIYATQDGVVTFSKDVKQKINYGRHIRIHHADKINDSEYTSIYGHLSARFVEEGETVKARQLIGLSGGATNDPYSGFSSGPHLHFEIRLDKVENAPQVPGGFVYGAIDPEPLLVSHEFNEEDKPVLFEAKCIVGVLNKRYGPSTNFGKAGVLKQGDIVKVYEVKDNWFKIDPRLSIWCSGYEQYMEKL